IHQPAGVCPFRKSDPASPHADKPEINTPEGASSHASQPASLGFLYRRAEPFQARQNGLSLLRWPRQEFSLRPRCLVTFVRLRRYVNLHTSYKVLEFWAVAKCFELYIVLYNPQEPGSYPRVAGEDILKTIKRSIGFADDRKRACRVVMDEMIVRVDGY